MFSPETLKARFNPEGSLLRRHQLRMTDMLVEIDRICRKHHLAYWLGSGTLIGAVRHQGFIPWDDDLDIEMTERDYRKLLRILPQELPPHLALQSQDTDPNYLFFYAKIRDRRSLLEENNHYDKLWKEQGIYIDVFPIHRQTIWLHKLSEAAFGHTYKILRCGGSEGKGLWKARLIKNVCRYGVFPMLKALGWLFGRYTTYAYGIPYHSPRPYDQIFPLKTLDFEGHSFPVPNDYDSLLRSIYGNYMELPNLDKLDLHVERLTIDD